MSDRLEVGMRVRYIGPDPYRHGTIAIITRLGGNVANVQFEADGRHAGYYLHKLQPLEITLEQQQRIDEQRRRLAHADRYL